MVNWNCLEDLESRNYHNIVLLNEFGRRFSDAVNSIPLGLAEAKVFTTSLMNCGFSFLEALFFLCGPNMYRCTLLSRKTQKLAYAIIKKEWDKNQQEQDGTEECKDILDNKLDGIMQDLDEHLFKIALKADSIRLDNVLRKHKVATV
jgi:hypothetical protein